MAQVDYINFLREEEGLTINSLTKRLGINWRTAKKYADRDDWSPDVQQRIKRNPILGPYLDIIEAWLTENLSRKRKQCHTNIRIYQRLRDECDYPGGVRTVTSYVSRRKKELRQDRQTYSELVHPGEVQVDFGTADVICDGTWLQVKYLTISFPYSNAAYLVVLPRETITCFLEGLKQLFTQAGGVTRKLWFDNLSAAVVKIKGYGERDLTDIFRHSKCHYWFEVVLNNGVTIPSIGFSTYRLNGNAGASAIKNAIDNGYRLIDTAYNYENEGAVGEALRRSPIPSEDLFITSKLPGRYQTYDKAVEAIQESLYRVNLDYYDLYLIHWPNPDQGQYVEAWKDLSEARKRGLIRSIGVCNFLPEHIDRLDEETGVKPSINQIELHPFFNQETQRQYDTQHNVKTQSWSPLAKMNEVVENETIRAIAQRHQKTISQVILRWHYELRNIPIPKSSIISASAGESLHL